MSTIGALWTSSIAMMAQSTALDHISGNIANINTTGYKETQVNFKTLISGSTPQWNFLAVGTAPTRHVEDQGQLLQTNGAHDVAVNGVGLFMLADIDDDGTTSQGQTKASSLNSFTFPSNGNSNIYYTRDGSFTTKAIYHETGTTVAPPTPGGPFASDAARDAAIAYARRQDTYLMSGGSYVLGWAADEAAYRAGTDPFQNTSVSALKPVKVDADTRVEGLETQNVAVRANIDASATTPQTIDMPVWDEVSVTNSAGATQTQWIRRSVPLVFTPVSGEQNTWTLSVGDNNGTAGTVSPAQVTFGRDGKITSPTGAVSLTVDYPAAGLNNGSSTPAASQNLTLDLKKLTQYTDVAGTIIYDIDADGYGQGNLLRTYFNNSGVLTADYDNGTSRPLFKLALADFPASQNLTLVGNNKYVYNDTAGERRIIDVNGSALSSSTEFVAGALEASTVDLTDQFSRMITTQTAYSQAATVFRTADEMTQVATSLKS